MLHINLVPRVILTVKTRARNGTMEHHRQGFYSEGEFAKLE